MSHPQGVSDQKFLDDRKSRDLRHCFAGYGDPDMWNSGTPLPINPARIQEGLGVQQKVDAFLMSLPLGVSTQDAAIENAIAERLTHLYEENSGLKTKLDQWYSFSSDL